MPLSVEEGQRLIAIEAEIRRREHGGARATPPRAAAQAGPEPVTEGGVPRLLAARPADNPIVGVGSQGPPAQRPPGGAFVPDEPPLQETLTKPSTMVPLVASAVLGGGPAVVGTLAGGGDAANLGEMIGTTLIPGTLKPVAGMLGAGAGEGYRQWQAGEPLDWGKIARETAWSAAPEIVESTGRGMVRSFARNSPGGQQLRFEQGARESRQLPERVFQPRPADQISDAFEEVRRTGLPIDTQDMTRHLTTLSPGHQADALHLLTSLDRQHRTGGRYAQLYDNLLQGRGGTQSIGDLQNLRSHLRQEAEQMDPGEGRNFVRNLQRAVDDTIDFGMTSGAMAASTPQIRQTLHQARRDWAQRAAADDLSELVESKIRTSGDLSSDKIHISALWDDVRRGRSHISQSINRALDLTPGARDRFNTEMREIARLYNEIQIPMTDVAGLSRMPIVAEFRQQLGQVLLHPVGRRMFRDAIIDGRGTLSPNAMAAMVNAVRREERPEMVHGKAGMRRDDSESRRAPGGVARSTD